jgi:hypothetical protein
MALAVASAAVASLAVVMVAGKTIDYINNVQGLQLL